MAKGEKTKDEVRMEIIEKCKKLGVGKKPMTFLLTKERNNYSLRPKCKYVDKESSYGFNMRYAPVFDNAFEDEQDNMGPIDLRRVDFPGDRWTIYPDDPCLQMYLLLHPFCGKDKVFYLEDKVADAQHVEDKYAQIALVIELCRSSDIESLQAVYSMLYDSGSAETNQSILRSGILEKMETNQVTPDYIVELFNDKQSKVKFHLTTALRLNVVKMNAKGTDLSWFTGGKIYSCAPGLNIKEEFAQWVGNSEEGKSAYEKILQKIN